jgi:hypothetical protein
MSGFFIKVIFPTVRGTFQFITICSVKEKERNRDCRGSTHSCSHRIFHGRPDLKEHYHEIECANLANFADSQMAVQGHRGNCMRSIGWSILYV